MDRRSLLRMIGLAPIALPTLAAAAPAKMATGGYAGRLARPFVVGEVSGESFMARSVTASKAAFGSAAGAIEPGALRLNFPVAARSFGFVDGDGI